MNYINGNIVIFDVPYWYTLKFIDMLVIIRREYRQRQREYFERVDNGEQIIVQRSKDKAYVLTPISEDDIYFNAEMVEKIKQSIDQVKQGKTKKVKNPEDISKLLVL